jgi:hypothetical protein
MKYIGVIIKESLADKSVLNKIKIIDTKIEPITPEHKTPWLKQWTLHTISVDNNLADNIAKEISLSLDYSHNSSWYADYKNDKTHYIIFKDKIFKIDRTKPDQYKIATEYGISLGIPEYQVDFSPNVVLWER